MGGQASEPPIFKRILCGVDGTHARLVAVRQALRLSDTADVFCSRQLRTSLKPRTPAWPRRTRRSFSNMTQSDDVVWSLADFVLAGVLLTTISVSPELAARKAGNLAIALGIAALGVAAGVLGEADDAPGLVFVGIALIASGCAVGIRTFQRSR